MSSRSASSVRNNAIEGKFSEAKRHYGLNRVMTRLSDTSASVIHLIMIVMNLKKSLRDLLLTLTSYGNEVTFGGLRQITLFGSNPYIVQNNEMICSVITFNKLYLIENVTINVIFR